MPIKFSEVKICLWPHSNCNIIVALEETTRISLGYTPSSVNSCSAFNVSHGAGDVWAWFGKSSFTAQTVSSNYPSTNLSYAPYIHKWVIHALRVSSFGDDNMLSGNHLSFYRRHKSWHNLFVGFQALVILELIIWAKACVKNQIAKQMGLFDWL